MGIEKEADDSQTQSSPLKVERNWSYSRLSTFLNCERSFYYKYILKLPVSSSLPMIVGKIFHRAMELVMQQGYSPDEAVLYAAWEAEGIPEGEKAYYLKKMVERTLDRLQWSDYAEVDSEVELNLKTTKGNIVVKIDLIINDPSTDLTEIIDFKTSWTPYEAASHKQLWFYAWILYEIRSGFIGSQYLGRLVFPRLDQSQDTVFEITEEHLKGIRQWFEDTVTLIDSKDPNSLEDWKRTDQRRKCEYCPFVGRCSQGYINRLPIDSEPKNEVEASLIGTYILDQEKILSRMKDNLKKWVKKNKIGIPVGTGEWNFVSGEPNPKVIDMEGYLKYLEDRELNLTGLTVTPKELKTLLVLRFRIIWIPAIFS